MKNLAVRAGHLLALFAGFKLCVIVSRLVVSYFKPVNELSLDSLVDEVVSYMYIGVIFYLIMIALGILLWKKPAIKIYAMTGWLIMCGLFFLEEAIFNFLLPYL